MAFVTSQNPGMTQAANAITKIFVGDPTADAKYRDQQIKNETEYLRQKQLTEQTVSEAVKRKQMEAAANASNAAAGASTGLANERNRKNTAATDLGALFTADHTNYQAPGGMSVPGDAPAGTPGKGFDMNDPATAAKVVSLAVKGGMDPKTLAPIAMMPGQSDDTLARIMVGTGNTLGKDEYVSTNDRNKNRRFDVGGNSRLADSEGDVKLGLDPTQELANTALANERNAKATTGGKGNKIPKLDQKEMNRYMRSALMTRGGNMMNGETAIDPGQFLQPQPELYADMSRLIDEAYSHSGGRASAVQDALAQYLDGTDFSNFGTPNPGVPFVPFTGNNHQLVKPKVDVQSIIEQLYPQAGAQPQGISPNIFTEGGSPALPNRQNVGTGSGWKVLGVQ